MTASRTELVIYTKSECPLCDEALERLRPLARRRGLELRLVDIESAGDAGLWYRHRYRIPVVECRGEELAWGRIRTADVECRLDELLPRDPSR